MGAISASAAGKILVCNVRKRILSGPCRAKAKGLHTLHLVYSWPTPQHDLDTATSIAGLEGIVGWHYQGGTAFLAWSGDNTGYGPELVDVDVAAIHQSGGLSYSLQIVCCADWYTPAGGAGTATLTVTDNLGITRTIEINPNQENAGAVTRVATITILGDGTWSLTAGG